MKFPFEFSIKLIFRLIIPGAILAAAMAPAVHAVLHASGIRIPIQYIYPFEAIAWGWVVVLCDMHIYMLFEGRRYWPRSLHAFWVRQQERRKARLAKIFETSPAERERREAEIEYGLYPIDDEDGETKVTAPTRLGNLIDSFETYSDAKYGLDGVFFWYRLWVVIDKDLREEIDNAQSLPDSAVYLAFVLYVSGLVMFVYAIIGLTPLHLPYVPAPWILVLLGVVCLVGGFAVYRLSLPAHAQFGELFKALFDQYRKKLAFDDVLTEIETIVGDLTLSSRPSRERNRIVWRYLRWHLVRDELAGENVTIKELRRRQAERQT